MRHFGWSVVVGCAFFAAPVLAQGEAPPPGEPPKPSAEPAPPSSAANPEAAPAPPASPPVVQMEDTAGASATAKPVAPSTPAPAVTPGTEPPITAGALEETTRGGPAPKGDDWHFDFHGYLRAPLRVGLGHNDHPAAGQSSSTIH